MIQEVGKSKGKFREMAFDEMCDSETRQYRNLDMLTYAIERFLIPLENWRDRKDDRWRFCTLDDYRSNLISYGFMCRESCELYEDKDNAVVYLAGILGHHSALEDSLQHPRLAELQEKMESELVAERSVQRFEVYPDDAYCEHDQWDRLILGCNSRLGTPSIMCGQCSGLIAAYRVKMNPETATRLWAWERQYSSIDNLSGLCDEYEEWADTELHRACPLLATVY